MSQLQLKSEKRKLVREQNNDSNIRIRKLKFDQDAVKLSKHEQKKQARTEFAGKV